MPALSKGHQKLITQVFFAVVALGAIWRLGFAMQFHGRAWIDELHVVLKPAFRVAFELGSLPWGPVFPGEPREETIRSWIPPLLAGGAFKLFSLIGITNGVVVLPLLKTLVAAANCFAALFFAMRLGARAGFRSAPVLPAAVVLLTPELVHYSATLDLSSLGLPLLLAGLGFASAPRSRKQFVTAASLLGASALIRFQYAVFPLVWLAALLLRREFRQALTLALIGTGLLGFDFALNSILYGHPILPVYNYFLNNTAGGLAASYGTSPFYHGFELLWRFTTEPVFALIVFSALIAFRYYSWLAVAAMVFYAIHCVVGHKEYRFFFGTAVPLATIAAASLQKWIEERPRGARLALGAAFVVLFVSIGSWRAVKKVGWSDYDVPTRLETLAGSLPDAQGLIVYGWNGIYSGGRVTMYRRLPYIFVASRAEIGSHMGAYRADDFNYVITGSSEPAPCATDVAQKNGARLYRCTSAEIETLASH